jgi:hypothetical protein
MTDISTGLELALQRATDGLIDEIAQDGLEVLKNVVDSSGFARSPYLKNYQVLAHVDGGKILFEIIVDISALNQKEQQVREMLESAQPGAVSEAARTYGIGKHGAQRVIGQRDARQPIRDARRDARKPSRDARKTSGQRLLGHEMALHAPRSMNVTREGKLSVMFSRSLRETKTEIHYPKGQFQGLLARFINEFTQVVAKKFAPALEEVLKKYTV